MSQGRRARLAGGTALFGALVLVLGLFLAPERAALALRAGALLVLGLGAGALFFLAVGKASNATWFASFIQAPRVLSSLILPGGLLLLLALALGGILPGLRTEAPGLSHAGDPGWFREWWLKFPFLLLRAGIIILLWVLFRTLLVKQGRAAGRALATLFLIVFGLTASLSAFDWIMPLWKGWSSTMFGVYLFSGLFTSSLGALVLLALAGRRASPALDLRDAQLHDLGKLLFGFSCFWMYIWFCQHMLIWYTDIPEEAAFYAAQLHGGWTPLFVLNIGLNWAFPFFALLPRPAKMSESVMMKASVSVLLGRFLDLYLAIYPSQGWPNPPLGPWELAAVLGSVGLTVFALGRAWQGYEADDS